MNKLSYGFALSLALCLAMAPAAMADSPPACTSNTAAYYDANYGGTAGCTIGSLTFNEFFYSSAAIAANEVEVNPGNPPPGSSSSPTGGPGFNFTGPFAVNSTSGPDAIDVNISFDVTAAPGTSIADIYIDLANSGFTGTGTATYNETFCTSGGTCFLQVETPSSQGQTDVISLDNTTGIGGPTTFLSIDKDLSLNAGSNGSVNASSFGNQYSLVPEPRGVSLVFGFGLLAGFAFFKRRQVAQS